MNLVKGGCHCGLVRFTAKLPAPPISALSCNCSICTMTGYLHVLVPHQEFELLTGSASLTSYRFGSRTAEHLFCATCGVKSFYQPRSHPDAWSVNAHCLDVAPKLSIKQFDGRNWEIAKAALDENSDRS